MTKTCLIFDYFKEAFHINKKNKGLYLPQIIFIMLKVLMIILIGVKIYSWIGTTDFYLLEDEKILDLILNYGLKALVMILGYGIISVFIESGLYNMYKKCILLGTVESGNFNEGVKKYFFKFLLGYIIIVLAWMIILPFYFILGILTIFIGFTIIPIIINIFLTMWKISIVTNDSGVFTAFKDSFKFAKNYFFPVTILQLIHWSFVTSTSSKPNLSFNFNGGTRLFSDNPFISDSILNEQIIIDEFLNIMKIVLKIIIPVITIATLVASLIKMIFEVFFSLVLFVAYNNGFSNTELTMDKEVLK